MKCKKRCSGIEGGYPVDIVCRHTLSRVRTSKRHDSDSELGLGERVPTPVILLHVDSVAEQPEQGLAELVEIGRVQLGYMCEKGEGH